MRALHDDAIIRLLAVSSDWAWALDALVQTINTSAPTIPFQKLTLAIMS
jgi:hypothetical protein